MTSIQIYISACVEYFEDIIGCVIELHMLKKAHDYAYAYSNRIPSTRNFHVPE